MSIHFFTATLDFRPYHWGGEGASCGSLERKAEMFTGLPWLPTQVGHSSPADTALPSLSLLLPSSPSNSLFPPHPPHPSTAQKTSTTSWITETRRAGFLVRVVSVTPWCRHWEGPALARARQGLVPRKAAGASCRAPPPGGIGSDEPKH